MRNLMERTPDIHRDIGLGDGDHRRGDDEEYDGPTADDEGEGHEDYPEGEGDDEFPEPSESAGSGHRMTPRTLLRQLETDHDPRYQSLDDYLERLRG